MTSLKHQNKIAASLYLFMQCWLTLTLFADSFSFFMCVKKVFFDEIFIIQFLIFLADALL